MELEDWIINTTDLHFLKHSQYKMNDGTKAHGDYLLKGRYFRKETPNNDLIIIGKSPSFTIYLCEWRGLLVAVKRLNENETNHQEKERLTLHLQREIAILVKMHHPNIVQILGITLEPFQIILEYFPLRDLVHFQNNHNHSLCKTCWKLATFSFKTKYKWTTDLLLALIYLHERRPESVIHRDLKPSNILITNDGTLKITDFGLSKLHNDFFRLHISDNNLDANIDNNKSYTFNIGTYWYMSPEIVRGTPYDNKMDIWSLGLILYEIWEEKRINTIMKSPGILITHNDTRHEWIPFSFRTKRIIRTMILQCLSLDPDERPTVRNLLSSLLKIKNSSYCCCS